MLIGVEELDAPEADPFDICIIGAGAAGLSLARNLDRRAFRICLLESGRPNPSREAQSLNDADCIGLDYDLAESRCRALGGTLHTWQGTIAPLDPIDFEARDWISHSGWPLSTEVMRAAYDDAYSVLGVGDVASRFDGFDAQERSAIQKFGAPLDIFEPKPFIILKQHLEGLCRRLRRDVVERDNVLCVTNATVTEIIPQADQGNVISYVEVRSADGDIVKTVHAKRFIICTGGLEAPRLLLASRGTLSQGLGNDYDLVGRFFMDHPRLRSTAIALPEARSAPILRHVALGRVASKAGLVLSERLQRERRLANYNVFLTNVGVDLEQRAARALSLRDAKAQDAAGREQTRKSARMRTMQTLRRAWRTMPVRMRVGMESALSQSPFRNLAIVLKMEQAPNRDSRITLSDRTDRLGVPRLVLDWRLGDEDMRMLQDFETVLNDAFSGSGLARQKIEFRNPDGGFTFQDSSHPMGGARMAEGPRSGVVDRNLRVFGVDNLYVASSAVFPTAGNANPTLTIIALSCRLAKHLNAEARRPDVATRDNDRGQTTPMPGGKLEQTPA